jgi:transposase
MKDKLVPEEEYNEIEKWIKSDDSVVGIDAKETHIIIIHKLMILEKELSKLKKKLKKNSRKSTKKKSKK